LLGQLPCVIAVVAVHAPHVLDEHLLLAHSRAVPQAAPLLRRQLLLDEQVIDAWHCEVARHALPAEPRQVPAVLAEQV